MIIVVLDAGGKVCAVTEIRSVSVDQRHAAFGVLAEMDFVKPLGSLVSWNWYIHHRDLSGGRVIGGHANLGIAIGLEVHRHPVLGPHDELPNPDQRDFL